MKWRDEARRRGTGVGALRLLRSLVLSLAVLSPPPLLHRCRTGGCGPLSVMAVDHKKFRKCANTGFCKRNRNRSAPPATPFRVVPESLRSEPGILTASVLPGISGPGDFVGGSEPLSLSIRFFTNGACRLKVEEALPADTRWEPPQVFLDENLEPAEYKMLPPGDPSLPPALEGLEMDWKGVLVAYGGTGSERYLLSFAFDPFRADLFVGDELLLEANARGLMHFEQRRDRDSAALSLDGKSVDLHRGKKVADYGEDGLAIYEDGTKETKEEHHRLLEEAAAKHEKDESDLGLWEETFSGHPDSKPEGPTSVGMDIDFPGSEHVYGIPEHATSMSLKSTIGAGAAYSEPYRLYTLDVFEYELDSPAALYGAIPVMLGHRPGATVGVFWFNPTETFVDVGDGTSPDAGKQTHWISEGGALDVVLMPGPTPADVFRQYSDMTGKPELPPLFALGFHQCRWNYRDEPDVLAVDAGFEERDIPYDVIWLDIEHTDGKRYFTWDKGLFPDPKRMVDKVLAVLQILGRGNCYHDVCQMSYMSESAVCQTFHTFCRLFAEELYDEYIRLPVGPEHERVMEHYHRVGFTGAVGSTDVTHVRWDSCPFSMQRSYTGKEGYPTLAYQATVDHTGRVLGVTPGFAGAQNDKTIARFDPTIEQVRDNPLYRDKEFSLRRKDGSLLTVKGNYLIVDNGYHKIAAHGRRMVTIVDPHIKRDSGYHIHKEATAKGYYVKDKDGKDFEGWCWPGQSSYLDFTDEQVREWWASKFALDQYVGSTLDLYTWNDMNEPSVFNGPEVSMKKDCLSLAGVEHRNWHNLYGMYMQRATAEGLELPRRGKALGGGDGRPFVLARSFYAGSQRWGAIWTGDNAARWDHLAVTGPMLLSMSLAGLPFVGADVGGFFGDPSAELFLRWMQAGAYQPFFRSHAHHDSKRREPWVYGEPWTSLIRLAIMARYSFLPYWYTLFQEASQTGVPMMRPMWVQYPLDRKTFEMDNQWMVGGDLLVKPVTAEGARSVEAYLPAGRWYDSETMVAMEGDGSYQKVEAPLEKIPVFQRGGSIVPRKMRLRRSSRLMSMDPFTLVIALDESGEAEGTLYLDDEESFDHKIDAEGGGRTTRRFAFRNNELVGEPVEESGNFRASNTIERIVIAGLTRKPDAITLATGSLEDSVTLGFDYDPKRQVLTVRKPDVPVCDSFVMALVEVAPA